MVYLDGRDCRDSSHCQKGKRKKMERQPFLSIPFNSITIKQTIKVLAMILSEMVYSSSVCICMVQKKIAISLDRKAAAIFIVEKETTI